MKFTVFFSFIQRYQLQINDRTQPLLVSKPTRRNRRAGITGPILLIPEFCRETGANFVECRRNFDFIL